MLDLIIIGGSSAATSAGIYAARRGLNFKIVTKDFSGELATSGEIGNWPGIPQTNGIELAEKFREHLEFLNVAIDEDVEITSIAKEGIGFSINTGAYKTRTVILATGAHPRELKIPGEREFRNKGLSYCTTCDGPLFAGKVTATIGGGNSALESALMLADISKKVYVVNKNAQFKGDQVLIDNLNQKKNVEIIYNALTTEIIGGEFVTGYKYKDARGKENSIETDGIFVHIGMRANSYMAPEGIEKNQSGEIIVNMNCETNIPGFFAAGDVTNVPFKQNPIAAGQGTVALLSAVSYLNRLK